MPHCRNEPRRLLGSESGVRERTARSLANAYSGWHGAGQYPICSRISARWRNVRTATPATTTLSITWLTTEAIVLEIVVIRMAFLPHAILGREPREILDTVLPTLRRLPTCGAWAAWPKLTSFATCGERTSSFARKVTCRYHRIIHKRRLDKLNSTRCDGCDTYPRCFCRPKVREKPSKPAILLPRSLCRVSQRGLEKMQRL